MAQTPWERHSHSAIRGYLREALCAAQLITIVGPPMGRRDGYSGNGGKPGRPDFTSPTPGASSPKRH